MTNISLISPASGLDLYHDTSASILKVHAFTDGRLLTSSDTGLVKLWSPLFKSLLREYKFKESMEVHRLTTNADESFAYIIGGTRGGIQCLDLNTGDIRWAHSNFYYNKDVCYVAKLDQVIVAQGGTHFLTIDASSGEIINEYGNPDLSIDLIKISPLADLIIFADETKLWARTWPSMSMLWSIPNAHNSDITSLTFSTSGDMIATGSPDCKVKIWQANTGAQAPELERPKAISDNKFTTTILDLLFSNESNTVVAVQRKKHIHAWNIATGKLLVSASYPSEMIGVKCMALTNDDKHIIVGNPYGKVVVYTCDIHASETKVKFPSRTQTEFEVFCLNYEIEFEDGYFESPLISEQCLAETMPKKLVDLAQEIYRFSINTNATPIILLYKIFHQLCSLGALSEALYVAVFSLPTSTPNQDFIIHDARGETVYYGKEILTMLSILPFNELDENSQHKWVDTYKFLEKMNNNFDEGLDISILEKILLSELSGLPLDTLKSIINRN